MKTTLLTSQSESHWKKLATSAESLEVSIDKPLKAWQVDQLQKLASKIPLSIKLLNRKSFNEPIFQIFRHCQLSIQLVLAFGTQGPLSRERVLAWSDELESFLMQNKSIITGLDTSQCFCSLDEKIHEEAAITKAATEWLLLLLVPPTQLKRINFSRLPLQDTFIEVLLKALASNKTLQGIILNDAHFSDAAAKELLDAFARSQTLQHLSLSSKYFSTYCSVSQKAAEYTRRKKERFQQKAAVQAPPPLQPKVVLLDKSRVIAESVPAPAPQVLKSKDWGLAFINGVRAFQMSFEAPLHAVVNTLPPPLPVQEPSAENFSESLAGSLEAVEQLTEQGSSILQTVALNDLPVAVAAHVSPEPDLAPKETHDIVPQEVERATPALPLQILENRWKQPFLWQSPASAAIFAKGDPLPSYHSVPQQVAAFAARRSFAPVTRATMAAAISSRAAADGKLYIKPVVLPTPSAPERKPVDQGRVPPAAAPARVVRHVPRYPVALSTATVRTPALFLPKGERPTASSDSSVQEYIPSGRTRSSSMLKIRDKYFIPDSRTLAKGFYGATRQFIHAESGDTVIVKKQDNSMIAEHEFQMLARLGELSAFFRTCPGSPLVMSNHGEELWEYMKRNSGKISTVEMLELFIKIILALQRIHIKGIVHGDIHSGNICIDRNGVVSFVDFGLSYRINGKATVFKGFAEFLAPERCGPAAIKNPPAANFDQDMYSLCYCFREILSKEDEALVSILPCLSKLKRPFLQEMLTECQQALAAQRKTVTPPVMPVYAQRLAMQ